MEKDEFFLKRIRELANLSWQRDIVTFSDFLNLNEQNIVSSLKHQFPQIVMETSGGYENAERQMVAFHPDALAFTWEYPIDCLRIEPKALKFSEELSHRDYLGALMNLGIERELIGDIIIKDSDAYIFCISHIADYICDNLDTIRHTHIHCSVCEEVVPALKPELEDIRIIAASPRIDAVVASITKLSRSNSNELFSSKKIYVNGQCIENKSAHLKPDDILVIRGIGKFIYVGDESETRKGRTYLTLKRYI